MKPDSIGETGIARGDLLIFYASMLELIGKRGHVLGIDIRNPNKEAIESHPLSKRITMLQGSSPDTKIVQIAYDLCSEHDKREGQVCFRRLESHSPHLDQ